MEGQIKHEGLSACSEDSSGVIYTRMTILTTLCCKFVQNKMIKNQTTVDLSECSFGIFGIL